MDKDTGIAAVDQKQSFFDRLRVDLQTREIRFLMRSFRSASLFFLALGFFIFGLNRIFAHLLTGTQLMYLSGFLVASILGLFFPLWYLQSRWSSNPLMVSNTVKNLCYGLTLYQFVAIFQVMLFFYEEHGSGRDGLSPEVAVAVLMGLTFGGAWIVYLVPVILGWFVLKRNQVLKLNRFLWHCTVTTIVLLMFVLFSVMTGVGNLVVVAPVMFVVSLVVLFVVLAAPVVTLYTFKATSAAINYEDEDETQRWHQYFVFVMLTEMFSIAVQAMRWAICLLGRR